MVRGAGGREGEETERARSRTRARNLCSHYATTEIHYERRALSLADSEIDLPSKNDFDGQRWCKAHRRHVTQKDQVVSRSHLGGHNMIRTVRDREINRRCAVDFCFRKKKKKYTNVPRQYVR